MQPRSFPPLVEAFLIVEQPRQRLSHWSQSLAVLDDGRAPPLAMVTAYYDPTTDQALLLLRYDELALGRERLAFLVETAVLAEIGMIQPAELSDSERRRFLGERLARCTLTVSDQRSVIGALIELSRRVRELKLAPKTAIASLPGLPPPTPSARASLKPRGTTEDPVLLVKPKSTRDDLVKLTRATREEGSLEHPGEPRRAEGSRSISPHIIPRPSPAHRAPTVEMPSEESAQLAAQLRAPSPGVIYARYLRSGRWVPVRIGALSLKGAALLTGALPRLQDHVDIALAFGDHRAVVRGQVRKVSSSEEAAVSGTSTFSVSFELDDVSQRQLVALLTAAREAEITIKAPPPRGARRFPVEWPVCLGTTTGTVRADALDVSRDGMFVRTTDQMRLDSVANFSMLLDDASPPVSGRARVVRQVREPAARTCGLAAGYGLQITEVAPHDVARWSQFLQRIERRANKRVLVGAAPNRLSELQTTLAALGYAVTGGTDPGALAQLASDERPVDAVLFDGGWLPTDTSASWLEHLFTARNVPCVTMHGDARRGRSAIDKLLLES